MGFPFAWVCDHLEDLERLVDRSAPLLKVTLEKKINEKTVTWLGNHRARLDAFDTDADTVILTFRPDAMTGRNYGLDAVRLEAVLARILHLRRPRLFELQTWRRESVKGGLSACLERVLEDMNESRERVVPPGTRVTVEEIDHSFLQIASRNSQSSEIVRGTKKDPAFDTIDSLSNIYQRLRSREAKWLTRLILKDFGPVKFPESLKCPPNAPPLPQCVQVQARFKISIPEHERLDGPSRVRLGIAAKTYTSNLPPNRAATTISSIADISPLSPTSKNRLNYDAMQHTYLEKPSSGAPHVTSLDNCQGSSISHSLSASKTGTAPALDSRYEDVKKREKLKHVPRLYGTGSCQLSKTECALRDCIFILAPCVAQLPWATENLLKWHGSRYVTSLKAFSQLEPARRCAQGGEEYRRIVLVEPFNKRQAIAFLKQVERLIKTKTKGRIEVYDWRLLEHVAKVDFGKELASKSWSKYRMYVI